MSTQYLQEVIANAPEVDGVKYREDGSTPLPASLFEDAGVPMPDNQQAALDAGTRHYYPAGEDDLPCGGGPDLALARTISDTNCLECLRHRAESLAGWRWTHPHNAQEVAILVVALGDDLPEGCGDGH